MKLLVVSQAIMMAVNLSQHNWWPHSG